MTLEAGGLVNLGKTMLNNYQAITIIKRLIISEVLNPIH